MPGHTYGLRGINLSAETHLDVAKTLDVNAFSNSASRPATHDQVLQLAVQEQRRARKNKNWHYTTAAVLRAIKAGHGP